MPHRNAVLVVSAVLIFARTGVAQQQQARTRVAPTAMEAAAIAREQRALQALVSGDASAFVDALGLPAVIVGSDGIATWTAERATAFIQGCQTSSMTGSNFKPLTLGSDVVVLAYTASGKQVCRGQPTQGVAHALSVWQHQGNSWKLAAHSEAAANAPAVFDGVYQYLPPQRGLAVYNGNHFSFVFGPAAGNGALTTNAGTFELVGDTAVATILFSSDPANQRGSRFRYLARMLPGDTCEYTLIDSAGRVTGRGRALKIR